MPAKASAATREVEIDQDLPFERKNWVAERIGWVGMAVVVVLALAGLFGDGPLSQSRTMGDDGWVIHYEKYLRRETPAEFRVEFPVRDRGAHVVSIDADYLRQLNVADILPPPDETQIVGNAVRYSFALGAGTEAGASAETGLAVSFKCRPTSMGRIAGRIKVDGEPVSLSHWVHP